MITDALLGPIVRRVKSHSDTSRDSTRSFLSKHLSTIGKVNRFLFRGYSPFEPLALQIETTINCNLRCQHCERTYWPSNHYVDMSFDQFRSIIDQFHYLSVLSLTGIGEGLLNKDIIQMIRYAKSKNIFVSMTTNGTLLNPLINHDIISSGLDELSFSIESADPETYGKIRVGADFNRVIGNIKRFVYMKDNLGSNIPEVVLRTVAMKHTIHEIPGLLKLAHDISVKHLMVCPLIYSFKDGLEQPNPEEMKDVYEKSKELAKQLSVNLDWDLVNRGKFTSYKCMVPYYNPYIFREGYVAPCCLVTQRLARDDVIENFTFGNVLEEKYSKIQNNEKFKSFRRKLLSSDPEEIPDICKDCWMLFRG